MATRKRAGSCAVTNDFCSRLGPLIPVRKNRPRTSSTCAKRVRDARPSRRGKCSKRCAFLARRLRIARLHRSCRQAPSRGRRQAARPGQDGTALGGGGLPQWVQSLSQAADAQREAGAQLRSAQPHRHSDHRVSQRPVNGQCCLRTISRQADKLETLIDSPYPGSSIQFRNTPLPVVWLSNTR